MFFWVKYGFENTPVKMYNSNVSCAILLSFVKNTCIRDIEDYCKHKNIQLGIELDALRKTLQQQARQGLTSAGSGGNSAGALSTTRSTASSAASLSNGSTSLSSRPPSGASRPMTPGTTRSNANGGAAAQEEQNDEIAAALAQKELLEKELEVVSMAARYAKELTAGLAWVDLVDQHGAPLHLDQAGAAKVSSIVALREQYSVVAIYGTDNGEQRVTPLVFKLQA